MYYSWKEWLWEENWMARLVLMLYGTLCYYSPLFAPLFPVIELHLSTCHNVTVTSYGRSILPCPLTSGLCQPIVRGCDLFQFQADALKPYMGLPALSFPSISKSAFPKWSELSAWSHEWKKHGQTPERSVVVTGWRGDGGRDFLESEGILHDTVIVNTCLHTFVKTHRMYNKD